MERIKVINIYSGNTSVCDPLVDNAKVGTYYQMRVTDKDNIVRFVNLLFDCFGKRISAVDARNKIAFHVINEDLQVDSIKEGDEIDVEAIKSSEITESLALMIYK